MYSTGLFAGFDLIICDGGIIHAGGRLNNPDTGGWVQAYNPSAEKIIDSGRHMSSSGQVSFAVASSETQLSVIFYEKMGGYWLATERIYSVAIEDSVDTIPTGELAVNSGYKLFGLGPPRLRRVD